MQTHLYISSEQPGAWRVKPSGCSVSQRWVIVSLTPSRPCTYWCQEVRGQGYVEIVLRWLPEWCVCTFDLAEVHQYIHQGGSGGHWYGEDLSSEDIDMDGKGRSVVRKLDLEFFSEKTKKISLHFMSFLDTDMLQGLEICFKGRWEYVHWIQSISLLLMTWRCKEPGHQHQWYWPSLPWTFWSQHRGQCGCNVGLGQWGLTLNWKWFLGNYHSGKCRKDVTW